MTKNSSLYPEILFHFSNKNGLYGLLESTFKVSYAREKIIGSEKEREIGVPMVSFCDLRLSEIKSHMEKYGHYGIGLTKKWANKNGLNPVLYISRYSPFTEGLLSGLDGIHAHKRKIGRSGASSELTKDYINIYNTYRFIKNYEAPLKRKGKSEIENYRFADEREWRYVPPLGTPDLSPFVPVSSIKTSKQTDELNKSIEHIRLKFEPEDIRYLIVEKDEEISELINHLRNVKGRFNPETLNRLTSRILTADQIDRDI
jgi:hypothetical protein